MKKKVSFGIGFLVVIPLIATVGISWKASSSLLQPKDVAFPAKPTDVPVEDVQFTASDNVRLSGWYVPPQSCLAQEACAPAPGVVLSHGRATNRSTFLKELPVLHKAGFALLAFDYRGQGHSQNVISTAGAREQLDLDAAVSFLRGKNGVKPGTVAVLGKSLGASIAMLTAADNPNIGAVVEESGFAKLSDVVSYNFKDETGLPSFPFAPLGIKFAEMRSGVSLADVEPEKTIAKLSPRPLLVVHATGDTRVRFDQSDKIFSAALQPKERWILPGSEHADSITADPAGYEQHVVDFLKRNAT